MCVMPRDTTMKTLHANFYRDTNKYIIYYISTYQHHEMLTDDLMINVITAVASVSAPECMVR